MGPARLMLLQLLQVRVRVRGWQQRCGVGV